MLAVVEHAVPTCWPATHVSHGVGAVTLARQKLVPLVQGVCVLVVGSGQ